MGGVRASCALCVLFLALVVVHQAQEVHALKKSEIRRLLFGYFTGVGGLTKDWRVEYVLYFDFGLLIIGLGLQFFLEGAMLSIAVVACGYFAVFATLFVLPMAALDHPRLIRPSDAELFSKLCLGIIAVATIFMLIHMITKFLEIRAQEQAEVAMSKKAKAMEASGTVSSKLAEDILNCKGSTEGLLKLMEMDSETLRGLSSQEIGKELGLAVKSLVSFIKLSNLTILGSEAPIQVLYENHFIEKDVAIAFHSVDENHKQIMTATARLLEEYFLKHEVSEVEEENDKDK